jgi:hypothetical protein
MSVAVVNLRGVLFRYAAILLLALGPALSQAQALPEQARLANLETQVTAMEQAFLREEFETYADFLHPDVVRLVGGPDALAGQLRKAQEELRAQGTKVSQFTHGKPSRVVAVDRELQCTVPLTMQFASATGGSTVHSTLLAISTDGGKTWAFLDTLGKDWEALHRLLPNLSRELVLPGRKP